MLRKELRRDTLQRTSRGEYMSAEQSFKEIDVVRAKEKAFRVREEHARQRDEKGNLDKAFQVEKVRFAEEWAAKLKAVEDECLRRVEILQVEAL